MTNFTTSMRVSFGDCDPAGIVYYPNFFVWLDRTFHELLRVQHGGHAALCARLGAKGLGLMNVESNFRSPAREGDLIDLQITGIDWGKNRFEISYAAHVEGRLIFKAKEMRGIFIEENGKLRGGDVALLQELFEQDGPR